MSGAARYRERLSVALTLLVGAVACAASLMVFYPGFMSFDSALGLWLARHGEGFGMTPQIMTLTWRALLPIEATSGASLFIIDNLFFWLALCVFALALFRTWYARFLLLMICGLLSPCVLILAHIWSDALLVGTLSLACALLFLSVAGHGGKWAVLALPLLVYAGLVRFNALPALLPVFFFVGYAVSERIFGGRRFFRCALALMLAVAALAGIFSLNRVLEKRFVTIPMSAWAVVALWDLAAVSIATDEMWVPAFARPPSTTLEELRKHFREDANTTVFRAVYDNGNPQPYTKDQLRDINGALVAAIKEHPGTYFEHRWRLVEYLFGRYRNENSLAFYPGIISYGDNPPLALPESQIRDKVVGFYGKVVKTWWLAPVVYVLISLLLFPLLWRYRAKKKGRYALMMLISGLFYVAPLCLVAPSAELRYFSWLFFTTLMAAAMLLSLMGDRRRSIREGRLHAL